MSENAAVLAVELTADPSKLAAGMMKASQVTASWAEAAEKSMQTAQASFGGLDFSVVTSKAKAEQLKLIELQHQLDVARASGEKQTVVALSEEIALLQKVRQLRSAGFDQGEAGSAARATLNAVNAAREAAELREASSRRRESIVGNPSQALQGAFARVRLGSFEEAGAKVPVFGAQLEELGAAGLVAAAGVAAVALEAEKAKEAMEFSEQLDKDAKSLGLTTTQLQEFDYAAAGTSVGIDKGREALASFNEVFGRYSAGLAQGRTAAALNGLGFTPESARQIGSTTEALEKALSALAKLQNPQQRAALADRLGLKDFLPVLAEGQEGVDRFIATMAKAQGAGAVISPEQVQRAAELNDQLHQIEQTTKTEVTKAFIDLAPVVLQIAEALERGARALAGLAASAPDAARGLSATLKDAYRLYLLGTGNFSSAAALDARGAEGSGSEKFGEAAARQQLQDATLPAGSPQQIYHSAHQLYDRFASRGKADRLYDQVQDGLAHGVDPSIFKGELPPPKNPGLDLSTPKKAKAGPEDQTASLDKAALDAYQSALKSAATALAALTGDIEAHADLEKQAVAGDLTKKLGDLDKQEADILKAKLDAHRREQLAQIAKARTEEKNAAAARTELIDRNAAQALREKALQRQQEADAVTARGRTATADLQGGAYGKARAELDNLRAQQLDEVEALRVAQAPKIADGSLAQRDADQNIADLRGVQRTEYLARRQDQQRSINPLYARANPTTSITDDLQGIEGKGLDQLTDSLTSVVTGAKSAKDAIHDMSASIIADLARLFIQREIEGPLANLLFQSQGNNLGTNNGAGSVILGGASSSDSQSGLDLLLAGAGQAAKGLFGFAGGTDSAPGGIAEVGEDGPEDIVLPKGSQVIPNTQLSVPSRATEGSSLTIAIDAGGAFSFEHVADAVEIGMRRAAVAGAQGGRDLAIQRLSRRQRYSR